MKRTIILSCLAVMAACGVWAQESDRLPATGKKGQNILPAAGDFAIGIDATPFFNYFGNMFNNETGNTAPLVEGYRYGVYGKYFLKDNRALRFGVTFDIVNTTRKNFVVDDGKVVTNPEILNPTVEDAMIGKSNNIQLSAGYEFRRGYRRLQGFWGGEVLLGFNWEKDKYTYGNPITELNQIPTSTNFNGNIASGERTLSTKSGAGIDLGLGAFAGVEYFIAPKIAIGGELGIQFGAGFKGQGTTETEKWDAAMGGIQTTTTRTRNALDSASQVGFWTNPTGNIFLTFYF